MRREKARILFSFESSLQLTIFLLRDGRLNTDNKGFFFVIGIAPQTDPFYFSDRACGLEPREDRRP